nr:YihY/virulence factor BrkB family protein [Leucobacter salsicius]
MNEPEGPTQIESRSWKYILKRTISSFLNNQCLDGAAALTYYAVLALFPALVAIFSLLGVIGQNAKAADAVLGILEQVAPGETATMLRGPLQQLATAPGAGVALFAGIAVALWSASGYVGAFSRAMNRIYGVEEGRPFWKLRPMQLGVTITVVIAVAISALVLVLSGPMVAALGDVINASQAVQTAWSVLKWPLLAFVVIGLVALLYYATPNAQQPKFRWISPGALLAIIILGVATVGFGFYVTHFSNHDRTYGSLAGVVIFLLWLWIANLALLFGAEFDSELARGRQLQGGVPAEKDLHVAPRDTRQIEKRAKKERKLEAEGRLIRAESALEAPNERDDHSR